MKNKPLIGLKEGGIRAKNGMADAFMITAHLIEESLMQSGANPGVDYTYLDLYKLAQPFILDRYQKRELTDMGFTPKETP